MSDSTPSGARALSVTERAQIEQRLREANSNVARNRDTPIDLLQYVRDVTALLSDNEWLRERLHAIQDVLMGDQPRTIIEGDRQIGADGQEFPVIVRRRPEEEDEEPAPVALVFNRAAWERPEPPLLPGDTSHEWEVVGTERVDIIDDNGTSGVIALTLLQCATCGALWRKL